jgi:transcriptional regulator with XRE-family HTH domain
MRDLPSKLTLMLPADRILLERLGARLREIREAANLSQEAVGEKAGFGGKYIGEIEKGIRDVPLSTLRAVAENGLGIKIETLLAGRIRHVAADEQTHARDIEITAAILAELPMKIRRPLLALLKAFSEAPSQASSEPAPLSKAAERRRVRWEPPKSK